MDQRQILVAKELVIDLYEMLEQLLKSREFMEDLKIDIDKLYPNYMQMLEKRRKDMQKIDHGVVFAGETSAGKSTLINKILGKKLFKPKTHESTSTICKTRNSTKIIIVTESIAGEISVKDVTNTCDPKTSAGVTFLRNELEHLTDKSESGEKSRYRSVDVGFPISILKGNTIFVDTPGIGGSSEVTQQLMDYLPNAVSFVFVINVASAGGMMKDRLPEILKLITSLAKDNEMPCFDPKDVIFVTNKWDTICCDDDEDEDNEAERDRTWRSLKSELKKEWPKVQEGNIFKLNLKEVSQNNSNESTEQFRMFLERLQENIEKATNIRVIQHLRYLQDIMKHVSTTLREKLDLNKTIEEEQTILTKQHKEKILNMEKECKQIKETLLTMIDQLIKDIVEEIYSCMSSTAGKEKILNPEDWPAIMSVSWTPYGYEKEVNNRVGFYIEEKLKSRFTMFKQNENQITSFYQKVCRELQALETEWKNKMNDQWNTFYYTSAASNLDLPLKYIPLMTVVGAAGLLVITVTSPVWIPLMLYKEKTSTRRALIDEAYEKNMSNVRSKVKERLDSDWGQPLKTTIYQITEEVTRILNGSQDRREHELNKLRTELQSSRDVLERLLRKVNDMKHTALSIST